MAKKLLSNITVNNETIYIYDDDAYHTGDLATVATSGKSSDLNNDAGFITNAVNDLTNYYLKTQTYTKSEVDSLIGAITTISFEVVQQLPTTDIQTNVIYLVPKSTAQTDNTYDEYINTDGTSSGWEKIGDTKVDLSNYYTKSQTDTLLNDKADVSDLDDYYTKTQADTLLDDKVDKVPGKGLSTEDYTTAEKTKLSGVEAGAEVNQNAFTYIHGDEPGSVYIQPIIADQEQDHLYITGSGTVTVERDSVNLKKLIIDSPVIPVVSKTSDGLCPQLPNETATTKYLRQDGTWSVPGQSGGDVTGVKGDAESNYRTGNVNLTPANIGALPTVDPVVEDCRLIVRYGWDEPFLSSIGLEVTDVRTDITPITPGPDGQLVYSSTLITSDSIMFQKAYSDGGLPAIVQGAIITSKDLYHIAVGGNAVLTEADEFPYTEVTIASSDWVSNEDDVFLSEDYPYYCLKTMSDNVPEYAAWRMTTTHSEKIPFGDVIEDISYVTEAWFGEGFRIFSSGGVVTPTLPTQIVLLATDKPAHNLKLLYRRV